MRQKPYDFVPLVPRVYRAPVPGHDVLLPDRYSGVITLSLEVLTPLHIGTGLVRVGEGGTLVGAFQRAGDRLVIPGSAVKGMARSIVEAVSYSCAPPAPKGRSVREMPRDNARPCNGEGDPPRLCPACGLFGFLSGGARYRGRVGFGQFVAADGTRVDPQRLRQLHEPQACREHIYLRGHEIRGRKFYYHGKRVDPVAAGGKLVYEVAPPGSRFTGELRVTNVTEAELSLLFFALGLDGSFAPKLGYGKPAYLGSVRFRIESANLRRGVRIVPEAVGLLLELARAYCPQDEEEKRRVRQKARGYGPVDQVLEERVRKLRQILNVDRPQGPPWDPATGGY